MNYNKKKQPFTVVERFRITEERGLVEYCRVKFHATGHVVVIPNGVVMSLDFEDTSLLEEETEVVEVLEPIVPEIKEEEELPVVQDDITSITPDEETLAIVATNPDGEEILVEDLEAFAIEYDLEIEAIESCLKGKQKTHKKWRFSTL